MTHGGARAGAGRPRGQGQYGESTKSVRLPLSRISEVKHFLQYGLPSCKIPLYASSVKAGFPSPADDFIECYLDLNEHLVKHPAATFFVRASGESMINAGIHSGDILVVDRSITPASGHIIIAAIDSELTVKRLTSNKGRLQLTAENPEFAAIDLHDEQAVVIWGVVTSVIHAVL